MTPSGELSESLSTVDELGRPRRSAIDGYGRVEAVRESYFVRDSGACAHQVDILGASLSATCSSCAAAVCAADVSCCTGSWSASCVRRANDVCPAASPVASETRYRYDVLGRLTGVTDALGNSIAITWDSLGNRTSVCDPDMGCWAYAYFPNGMLNRQSDAKGQTITLTYDSVGRNDTRQERDASGRLVQTVTYRYDRDAQGSSHGAGDGRLVALTDASGSTEFWYDSMGRVTTSRKVVTGVAVSVARAYDIAGRLNSIQYPDAAGQLSSDSEVVTYHYDSAGLLQSMTPYIRRIAHRADGSLATIEYGNGTRTAFQYDPRRSWLTAIVVNDDQQNILASLGYSLDAKGRIVSATFDNPQRTTFAYGYDDLDRLTTVRDGEVADFTYDQIGNMIYSSNTGNFLYPASGPNGCGRGTPCKGPHAASVTGSPGVTQPCAYDANGNMTSGMSRTINDWDVGNRPLTIVTGSGAVQFAYDGAGARVEKISGASRIRYFDDLVEIAVPGGLIKNYYAVGRLIARRDSAGLWYFHADRLGSPRLLTDAAGVPAGRYEYDAFGKRRAIATNLPGMEPVGFGGAEADAETGLTYLRARYYDAGFGRFLSADSIVPDTANPQALNRYSYAYNNPLRYVDPSGHKPLLDPFSGCSEAGCSGHPEHVPKVPEGWSGVDFVNFDNWSRQKAAELAEQRAWKDYMDTLFAAAEANLQESQRVLDEHRRALDAPVDASQVTIVPEPVDAEVPVPSAPHDTAGSPRKTTYIKFEEEDVMVVPRPKNAASEGLKEVLEQKAELSHEMPRAKREAIADAIEIIPVVGSVGSAALKYRNGEPGDSALKAGKGLAEHGAEHLVEHAEKPILKWLGAAFGAAVKAWTAWEIHKSMREYGGLVSQYEHLQRLEYKFGQQLGDPGAYLYVGRWNGQTFYYGPDGLLHSR
jgi:RHS repeat-associated protein